MQISIRAPVWGATYCWFAGGGISKISIQGNVIIGQTAGNNYTAKLTACNLFANISILPVKWLTFGSQ